MFFRIAFAFVFSLGGLSAKASAATELTFTSQIIADFEEARVFRAQVDSVEVVGAEVGPKKGRPLVLVGGFTSTFPYLRKFIRDLNAQNFRVFVYNPPGQGRGELYSGNGTAKHELGIDGMLKVFAAVRRHAFEASGGQKVVVAGHSLGGLQVRVGSLGVAFDREGTARFSKTAFQRASEETALIVPMFSMALFGDDVWESTSRIKAILLKDVAPFFVEGLAFLHSLLPWPFHRVPDAVTAAYLKSTQNSINRGLFGADDLDHDEVETLGRHALPQKVSSQIRKDMNRWLTHGVLNTASGLDLGERWENQQKSDRAIPALYIGGERDSLTKLFPFSGEAEALPSARLHVLDTGHIGAYLSHSLSQEMARLIKEARDEIVRYGCESWLKK